MLPVKSATTEVMVYKMLQYLYFTVIILQEIHESTAAFEGLP